ncbi:MAG: type III restriction endonuclease subunit R, partial [Ignavibacteria bacterium]
YILPKKSLFNRIIGDSSFELEIAGFLDSCDDIISFVKNYFAVHFRLDYKTSAGDLSNYYPDFIVKKSPTEIYIIETKGREDIEDPHKIERLEQWCQDINKIQKEVKFAWLFVKEEEYKKYKVSSFEELINNFKR